MKNILIVDDSKTFQKLIEMILIGKFNIVGKGSSGVEGFELFQKLKPDLVLMDITMPNCGGKECLQKIIQLDPKAKVIMVSGLADENTAEECLQLGAKAFVRKSEISQKNTSEDSTLFKTVVKVMPLSTIKEVA
jgi:two-component system chemotaxis response regulator CheY